MEKQTSTVGLRALSESDIEEFRLADGLVCPVCRNNTDIILGCPQTDTELVYEDRACPKCRSRFRVFFRVDDWAILDHPRAG
jgi:hypothetical protein